MGLNEDYAEKVISGKAKKEDQAPAPTTDKAINTKEPESPRSASFPKEETKTSLFTGMNLINIILGLGLVYAIYLAHQNKPDVVVKNHINRLQNLFSEFKDEMITTLDKRYLAIGPDLLAFFNEPVEPGTERRVTIKLRRYKDGKIERIVDWNPDGQNSRGVKQPKP